MGTKKAPKGPPMTIDTIDRQQRYVEEQRKKGKGLGVVFADAFLRGMRDIGYKNPAWAMCEQIDNAFQAGSSIVSVRFGYGADTSGKTKPDAIAICDNGTGMIPPMISFAVRWGGTDREGDRNGFGRYGYGLPSSAISMAKRYSVYSKTAEGEWHAVTVDIEELAEVSGDIDKTEELLTARQAAPPVWVMKAKDAMDLSKARSGTVIVLEDLDRLRTSPGWIKSETLKTKLLQHFGVVYRHWIPSQQVIVDGDVTQVVDPLFLMEHGRHFDENAVRAERLETRAFEVETSRGTRGTVTIRASFLPPHFQAADSDNFNPNDARGQKLNKRHPIMREYNGLLICRERRQIDCISPPFTKFQNNDVGVKIEIDFDPELDEFFGITTAKQQITVAEEMWEKLKHGGKGGGDLYALIKSMRGKRDEVKDKLIAAAENGATKDEPRASVLAMEETEKFKGKAPPQTPAQHKDAQKNLERAAQKEAERTGKPKEAVLKELEEKTAKHRWEVTFEAIPEGPFYRPERFGEQKKVIVNTDHPFYSKIYNPQPDGRASLEVLLFVLSERELESDGEAETFYKAERQKWSERLRHALDHLVQDLALADTANAMAEELHFSAQATPSNGAP
ncbi:MAG TPA: ATP-binding protein [Polyangiaceae bacterium]|jgi:hypothetical protein